MGNKRKPKGYICDTRFGILNPYGDIWTPDTFGTEAEAQKHIVDFWRTYEPKRDVSAFKVIRVRLHVTALTAEATNAQS